MVKIGLAYYQNAIEQTIHKNGKDNDSNTNKREWQQHKDKDKDSKATHFGEEVDGASGGRALTDVARSPHRRVLRRVARLRTRFNKEFTIQNHDWVPSQPSDHDNMLNKRPTWYKGPEDGVR